MTSKNNYKFRIDRVRSKHSRAEIIESLKEYAEIHGVVTIGMREYDAWNKRILRAETIRATFDSWGKALQAAGLRAERSCKLDLKEMVAAFKDCWRNHDSVPSRKQLENNLSIHNYPFRWISYMNVYGGLGNLAELIIKVQKGLLPESLLYQRYRKKPKSRSIPLKKSSSVLKRDNYTCVKCGASPQKDKTVTLEVDHIIPVSKGGLSKLGNLQTLCFECNQGKKDRED